MVIVSPRWGRLTQELVLPLEIHGAVIHYPCQPRTVKVIKKLTGESRDNLFITYRKLAGLAQRCRNRDFRVLCEQQFGLVHASRKINKQPSKV